MNPIIIPIKTRQLENISVDEVRLELRKIEEIMFGNLLNEDTLTQLNMWLEAKINIPFNLKIIAEISNNNLKLYGYTDESKEILDPNFKKQFISKKR